jgi:hypothetical protein
VLLEVKRPRITTTGRTQSYRVQLRLVPETLGEEVALFVVTKDGSILNFERIAGVDELRVIPTDPAKPEYRTDAVDLFVAAQGLADNMIIAINKDLQEFLGATVFPQGPRILSGASV